MVRGDLAHDPGLQPTPLRGPDGPFVGAAPRPLERWAREPRLQQLLAELAAAFGPQRWWPAHTPFEVLVGAVLTQNTRWSNVELALARLRAGRALTPARLLAQPSAVLQHMLHPAGTYRIKARRLLSLSHWYLDSGGLQKMQERSLGPLRQDLLGVHGIGPETADAILCYGAGRLTPVVDAYARRVLGRHGLVDPRTPYEELRVWLLQALEPELLAYQEFHALVVRAGTQACGIVAR